MIAPSGTLSDSTRSLTLRGRIGYRKEKEKKKGQKGEEGEGEEEEEEVFLSTQQTRKEK